MSKEEKTFHNIMKDQIELYPMDLMILLIQLKFQIEVAQGNLSIPINKSSPFKHNKNLFPVEVYKLGSFFQTLLLH